MLKAQSRDAFLFRKFSESREVLQLKAKFFDEGSFFPSDAINCTQGCQVLQSLKLARRAIYFVFRDIFVAPTTTITTAWKFIEIGSQKPIKYSHHGATATLQRKQAIKMCKHAEYVSEMTETGEVNIVSGANGDFSDHLAGEKMSAKSQ